MRANGNYDFGKRANLQVSVRRTLTHDVSTRNTGLPAPPTIRDDDLWQTSFALKVYFDV